MKSFKAGEIIARKGEYFPSIICIRKGMMRTYLLKSDGEEVTVRLAKEKDFTGCAESIFNEKPSKEFLQATEDCHVILINIKELKAKMNPRLKRLWNESLTAVHLEAIDRIEFFATLSPEERYKHIMDHTPDLIHRVPQKYLASFIGVSTVSISRIRSRVSKK